MDIKKFSEALNKYMNGSKQLCAYITPLEREDLDKILPVRMKKIYDNIVKENLWTETLCNIWQE